MHAEVREKASLALTVIRADGTVEEIGDCRASITLGPRTLREVLQIARQQLREIWRFVCNVRPGDPEVKKYLKE